MRFIDCCRDSGSLQTSFRIQCAAHRRDRSKGTRASFSAPTLFHAFHAFQIFMNRTTARPAVCPWTPPARRKSTAVERNMRDVAQMTRLHALVPRCALAVERSRGNQKPRRRPTWRHGGGTDARCPMQKTHTSQSSAAPHLAARLQDFVNDSMTLLADAPLDR